jgi:hypothetical protein
MSLKKENDIKKFFKIITVHYNKFYPTKIKVFCNLRYIVMLFFTQNFNCLYILWNIDSKKLNRIYWNS